MGGDRLLKQYGEQGYNLLKRTVSISQIATTTKRTNHNSQPITLNPAFISNESPPSILLRIHHYQLYIALFNHQGEDEEEQKLLFWRTNGTLN